MLLCALAGCNSQDAAAIKHDVGDLAKTGSRAIGNAQVVARVNAELAQHKDVDLSGVHVEAQNGTVTLGGHVRTLHEKHLMSQQALNIKGVDQVVNNLRVEASH